MSFFRSGSSDAVQTPQYTALQIQTSSSALPIPIVYGTNLVAPNIIWSGGFTATPVYTVEGSGGFLGIGNSHHSVITGYTYSVAIIFGLCEAPVAGPFALYQDSVYADPYSHFLSYKNGLGGGFGFPPARQQLDYAGTATIGSSYFDLGTSATTGTLNFEMGGFLCGSGINGSDADPAQVVVDFLTNATYGVGFPAASLDLSTILSPASGPDASYQAYCFAAGVSLSPALANQETANSILTRWLQLTNAAAVWSGGKLKIVPFGDGPLSRSANSKAYTFTPSTTALYDLTDEDFVGDASADPVSVARVDPYGVPNAISVEILDRGNTYAATPVLVFDQAAIEAFGYRLGSTITAHEICYSAIGQRAAQLILQRGLSIRNTYSFKLSWEFGLLEPMDLVTLTDANLGLAKTAVRITDVEEDADGLLTITAEEFPIGASTAVDYAASGASSDPSTVNAVPASVHAPVIFESPSTLTGGQSVLVFGVSGGPAGAADPNWGGCNIFVSYDSGASYAQVGYLTGASSQGATTAPLAAFAGTNPDTVDTLAVSMAASGTTLDQGSPAQARTMQTLALVDNEIVAYGSAVLSGPSAYNVTYLMRGLYGSAALAHGTGAGFLALGGPLAQIAIDPARVGSTLLFKFQSVNIFGRGLQDLSTCVAYPKFIYGSGLFGFVGQALAAGTSLDFGLASGAASQSDDFGFASDPYTTTIDLGLASA